MISNTKIIHILNKLAGWLDGWLAGWIPIVLDPYCPLAESLLSWIPIVLDPDPYCPGSLMSWIPNVLLKKSKSKKILYGLESNSQNLDFDGFLKKKSSTRARSDRKKLERENSI